MQAPVITKTLSEVLIEMGNFCSLLYNQVSL